MTLEELEASLASPIVATPPALLRPGVGPAARGAAGRGRGHLMGSRVVSGSFTSRCEDGVGGISELLSILDYWGGRGGRSNSVPSASAWFAYCCKHSDSNRWRLK